MLELVIILILGLILLILSTSQFVSGASTVATNMNVSSVLVGAVILGCGTGLPELALAFYGSHISPWRQLFHLEGEQGSGLPLVLFFILLVCILAAPTLVPGRLRRHSPLILAATITFSTLLRGSLDRVEGTAMIIGFLVGIAMIIHNDKQDVWDPFAPIIDEPEEFTGIYTETPVMTEVQIGITRVLCGLLGTAIGAQVLAFGSIEIMKNLGTSDAIRNVVFVSLGSLLPHIVVAIQALRQHHEGLAIGNLIGSSLFNSLAIGGLVSVIRPYQSGGAWGLFALGVATSTALLTWLLLHTKDEMTRRQGVALLGAYIGLVLFTVM